MNMEARAEILRRYPTFFDEESGNENNFSWGLDEIEDMIGDDLRDPWTRAPRRNR